MCLDPKDLNKAIKREYYRIPTMQEIASKFSGKKVFSTLDLKDRYWQIQLDEESSLLCTFNTPFGRYRFTRMPFGIRSASEVFQKHNEAAFADIPGLHIVADDLIIAANDIDEHDKILHQVLQRAEDKNIKLNFDKLQLRMNEVKYLGTIVTPNGIKPDPAKVEAILGMSTPTDKAGVRHLLGMINFLAAHIPDMSTIITAPVRDLLKSDVLFQWGPEQVKALEKIKEILSTAPVLSYYDPSARSTIQLMPANMVWAPAFFKKENQLHMLPGVFYQLNAIMHKSRRSYLPLRNFISISTDSKLMFKLITNHWNRLYRSYFTKYHQGYNECC